MKPCMPFSLLLVLPGLLPAQAFPDAGQVAVHAQSGPMFSMGSGKWEDIPALKGAVCLPKGGHLAIQVSLEGALGAAGQAAYLRALVDDAAAKPEQVLFFAGPYPPRNGAYTFHAPQQPSGVRHVRVQCLVPVGSLLWVGERSMLLRFADYASGLMRIAHARGPSSSRGAGSWQDVPGAALGVVCPWAARLEIQAAGEFRSKSGGSRLFLRALVDGVPAAPSDAIVSADPHQGVRSFTFHSGKVNAGTRQVVLQWAPDGDALVDEPVLGVTALPDAVTWQTAYLHQCPASGPRVSTTAGSFLDVPGLGGSIAMPAPGDLAVRFAAEAWVTLGKRFFLRAQVDGNAAAPINLTLATGDSYPWQGAREALFVVRGLKRGWHDVKVQWCVEAGGTAELGDRTLTITSAPGQVPLLVAALESDRGDPNYAYGGLFASSVVQVVGGKRVFRPYVTDWFFASRPGVANWFQENSTAHLNLVPGAVVGPYLKMYTEKYYREQVPDPFTKMKIEALQKADADFDYSYYDRNGDGYIRKDELAPMIALYQDSVWGEVRGLPQIPTNDGVTLDFPGWGQATFYTPDFKTTSQVGMACHELSHLLIEAGDMYESSWDPTAPGPFSIMDQSGPAGHLDPLHKRMAGKWFEFFGVQKDGWVEIAPISEGGLILQLADPASHAGEHFLVENRQRVGYDAFLPSAGLAIWHCDEKRLPDWRTAVEIEPACGPTNPIRYADYLFAGAESGFDPRNDLWQGSTLSNTRWHDSSPSGIGVWGIRTTGGGKIRAFLDVPGPGVLVQIEHPRAYASPLGELKTRVRVVNTGQTADSFRLDVALNGLASWTLHNTGLMASYEQRLLDLTVKPAPTRKTGTFTVTATSTLASSVTSADTGLVHFPLEAFGTMAPGGMVTLDCLDPERTGFGYVLGAAFGYAPGIPLAGLGTWALQPDVLFLNCFSMTTVFHGLIGSLDGQGAAQAFFRVPSLRALKGLDFYFAFVTYSPATLGLTSISNTVLVPIR